MAQATAACPQNPTRKLLVLLRTYGDVQLDQVALSWPENTASRRSEIRRSQPQPVIQAGSRILRSRRSAHLEWKVCRLWAVSSQTCRFSALRDRRRSSSRYQTL